jgi:hypothetical protein
MKFRLERLGVFGKSVSLPADNGKPDFLKLRHERIKALIGKLRNNRPARLAFGTPTPLQPASLPGKSERESSSSASLRKAS